ncbi:MAG: helix-turn-helix domain-containing protein, partial [Polaromonas sp.]|nr:helix-turn-helix domain-containing protein [Polaromonas sp.]
DLPVLCHDLLGRICRESGMPVPELSAQVLARLQAHPFNGNVRELENMLHRAVALGESSELQVDTQPAGHVVAVPVPENLQDFLDSQERGILTKVLQETGFNRTAAAARLGISLRQMRYRIARLNIVTPDSDDSPDEP